MAARLIDGVAVSDKLFSKLRSRAANLRDKGIKPGLAVVLVGNDPASMLYVSKKQKACQELGFYSEKIHLPSTVSAKRLLQTIERLNGEKRVHGILVQLPLPLRIDKSKVIDAISPEKDVDGFTSANIGRLALGREKDTLISCTPKGVIKLIESTGARLRGKNVTVIGQSIVVGKPLSLLLMNRNATVTMCNKYTRDLKKKCLGADVIISAAGVPKLIKAGMVKKKAIVIDVGITRVKGKIFGDVDFKNVQKKASFITPVPGGVGPMTVACLMENTIIAAENASKK